MKTANTFTVKVFTPKSSDPRYIPNCVLYKGVFVQEINVGIGKPEIKGGIFNGEGDTWEEYKSYKTSYKPFFNSFLLERDGKSAEAKRDAEIKGWDSTLMDKWLPYMFNIGSNEGNYTVIDADAEKKELADSQLQKLLKKEMPVRVGQGIFGYLIHDRLPAAMWSIVKPYATFHNGGDGDQEWAEDMGYYHLSKDDLAGWSYKPEAISKLLGAGYQLSCLGTIITNVVEINELYKKN